MLIAAMTTALTSNTRMMLHLCCCGSS